jgi:hypothetical protein
MENEEAKQKKMILLKWAGVMKCQFLACNTAGAGGMKRQFLVLLFLFCKNLFVLCFSHDEFLPSSSLVTKYSGSIQTFFIIIYIQTTILEKNGQQ